MLGKGKCVPLMYYSKEAFTSPAKRTMAAQIELRGFKDHRWKRSRFAPLSVNYELTWDNGTSFPEPCIDRIADTLGRYEALGWLYGGLSFFTSLGLLAVCYDKASKIPFTPKVYPYDNLRVELGREP